MQHQNTNVVISSFTQPKTSLFYRPIPTILECSLELSTQFNGQSSSWPLPFLFLLPFLPLSLVRSHGNLPHGLNLSNIAGSKVELTEWLGERVGQTLWPTVLQRRLKTEKYKNLIYLTIVRDKR